jgi:rSAM/selenodomain-associated transferase 2
VVIPALNEARSLPATLDALAAHAPDAEVVVVDAGSTDGTLDAARGHASDVRLVAPGGLLTRGAAMNAGAAAATGDVLWFLHADTAPGPDHPAGIRRALRDPKVVGGAFEFGFRERHPGLTFVVVVNRVRYRLRKRFYGDQGIFVRREAFESVGGFPEAPLMEDSRLCGKLRRVGRLKLVRPVLRTSARRFLSGGVMRVFRLDVRIWWTDLVGGDVERFAERYRAENLREPGGRCPSDTGRRAS